MRSAMRCRNLSHVAFHRQTTGNFDLDAIDVWRRTRNPHLFPDSLDLSENPLRSPVTASDTSEVIRQKIIAGLTPARNP